MKHRELSPVLLLVACLVASVVSACSGPRQRMPYELLAQLKLGVTTATEAKAVLGAPEQTASLADGGLEWRYYFAPDPPLAADGLPRPSNAHERPELLV